jgi:hypothetical protein
VAQATGYFLLNFGHLDMTFGKVIVRGHCEILNEQQDLLLPFGKSSEQITSEALPGVPSPRHLW